LGKTLIMGVGNILRMDDGFGIHVISKLREIYLPEEVRLVEAGTRSLDCLAELDGVTRLIAVDVMISDVPPGEIFILDTKGLSEPGKRAVSCHQIGILEFLQMAELIGYRPVAFILGTRPVSLDWGTMLTPPVEKAARLAVDFLKRMCLNNFCGIEGGVLKCIQ